MYAQFNGTLHFSNQAQSYGTAGIWLIATSITLVIVPIFIIYKNKQNQGNGFSHLDGHDERRVGDQHNRSNQSNYFNRSGDDSKLEMNDLQLTMKEETPNNGPKK